MTAKFSFTVFSKMIYGWAWKVKIYIYIGKLLHSNEGNMKLGKYMHNLKICHLFVRNICVLNANAEDLCYTVIPVACITEKQCI